MLSRSLISRSKQISISSNNSSLIKRSFSTTLSSKNELNVNSNADEVSEHPNIQLPTIDSIDSMKETGIPGLMSSDVLNDIWYNQSTHKLDDLAYGISGSPNRSLLESCFRAPEPLSKNPFLDRNSSAASVLKGYTLTTSNKIIDQYYKILRFTAKKPNEQYVFQAASSIYNLYYFLSSLKSNPVNQIVKPDYKELLKTPDIYRPVENQPRGKILEQIVSSFGSVEEFQALLLATAKSTKGNGYTWVLSKFIKPPPGQESKNFSGHSSLAILNTYNYGQPHHFTSGQITTARKYVEKKQKLESGELSDDIFTSVSVPSVEDAQDAVDPLDFVYEPLFAIGNNPSFWLRDFGVFGKEQYLNNVWNSIDWSIAEQRLVKENAGSNTERRFI